MEPPEVSVGALDQCIVRYLRQNVKIVSDQSKVILTEGLGQATKTSAETQTKLAGSPHLSEQVS